MSLWKPHVTVAAVIEQDDRFLLVEEKVDGEIVYNQPAGHLEDGESLVQAVVRETLEETGYALQPEALLGIYRWHKPGSTTTYLRFAFTGRLTGHDAARPLDAGILRAVWLTRAEIAQRGTALRSPLVLRCIDDLRSGQRHPLELLHDIP